MIRYATEEDFDWVYKLYEKNKFSLGPCYTASLRKSINTKQIIVDEFGRAFCEFHLPVRTKHIAVYNICVDTDYRERGIASSMIQFLFDNYSYPVKAVCIPNTDAEYFWKKMLDFQGTKTTRKGKLLHVYYKNKNSDMQKEVLF